MIVNVECFIVSQALCLLFHSILKFISATSIIHMFKEQKYLKLERILQKAKLSFNK